MLEPVLNLFRTGSDGRQKTFDFAIEVIEPVLGNAEPVLVLFWSRRTGSGDVRTGSAHLFSLESMCSLVCDL